MTRPNRFLLILVLLMSGMAAQARQVMIDTATAARLLNERNPNIVLIDMSSGLQYRRFHIPGAVHLGYHELVFRRRDGVSLRLPDERLYAVLGSKGIGRNSHVIIYDDTGGLNAGRLFWELERIGHARVSIIDGGLVAWILEGRKVTNRVVKPRPVRYLPGKAGRDNVASLTDVVRRDPRTWLLDVRSREEYTGWPRVRRSGHIPGARWLAWNQSVDLERAFRLKPAKKLLQALAQAGLPVKKDTPVILYCQSGHRAAQSYLVLRHLGFTRVRVYDGSMAEYSRYPRLPLRKGMTP